MPFETMKLHQWENIDGITRFVKDYVGMQRMAYEGERCCIYFSFKPVKNALFFRTLSLY